jgi:hypothetical protein
LTSEAEETAKVGTWLGGLVEAGVAPEDIGVFVRSAREFARAREAVAAAGAAAGLQSQLLDPSEGVKPGHVAVGIMERAKGLEFRTVAVLAVEAGRHKGRARPFVTLRYKTIGEPAAR